MKSLSIIQNFTTVVDEKPLELILLEIRTGFYRKEIFELSRLIHFNDLAHYENNKKALTTFTPSGVFKIHENRLVLLRYSQYIMISTGKISASEIIIARQKLQADQHTLSCFRSPSCSNLKIIVEVSSAWAYHKEAIIQVREYYSKLLALPIESSTRDLSQLCFYSYDSELFQNDNHQIFQIEIPNY